MSSITFAVPSTLPTANEVTLFEAKRNAQTASPQEWDSALVRLAFHGLADWTRLRIITELSQHREMLVNDIVAALGIVQPTVSRHLQVLRAAGLVTCRKDMTHRYYKLNHDVLTELRTFLASLQGSATTTQEIHGVGDGLPYQ